MIFDHNYLWNENRLLNSPWTVAVKSVPQEDERKDRSSSGISEADLLSKYDDDSSDDNDSVLEDGTEPQLLNKELGFLYTAPRTRSGRMVRTSNKAVLWLWFITKVRKTDRIKTFYFSRETWNAEFLVREMWNGHFIFHETWSIPPFTTLYILRYAKSYRKYFK